MTKDELTKKNISAISLGCDKNRVDLEKMLFSLSAYGFEIVPEVENADIVLVNTCAFILPAKREAIENIIEMEALKKSGKIEKLIVSGCLSERHNGELKTEFKEVDAVMRLSDNSKIVNVVEELYGLPKSKCGKYYDRIHTISCGYAHLKIADGCNNVCAFCTIPRIRGKYRSEKMDELVEEAKLLAKKGVKEIILVAQDTTRYGVDIYGKPMLAQLCERLAKIKELLWIRILYAYPEMIDNKLLELIETEPKMCKYLDIPMQHIDDNVLSLMRRRHNENSTRALIKKLKTEHSDIKIRSTFIVGHPGETKKAFKKLCRFLKEAKLDYVGFFPYYREENTVSYFMKNQVFALTKHMRLKKVQKIQEKIAFESCLQKIGSVESVMLDSFDSESGEFCGHSKNLAPLVDFGIKIVDNGNMQIGDIILVQITDFDGNNFKGELK